MYKTIEVMNEILKEHGIDKQIAQLDNKMSNNENVRIIKSVESKKAVYTQKVFARNSLLDLNEDMLSKMLRGL